MDEYGYSHAIGMYKSERSNKKYYYYKCDRCGKDANGYRLSKFRGHAYCEECKKLNQKEYKMFKRKSEFDIVKERLLDAIARADTSDGTEKVFSGKDVQTIVNRVFEGVPIE